MRQVNMPAFVFASREDHIVPWKTAFSTLSLFSGDNTFVLGASGHVAGVINPPAKNKRHYWVGPPDSDFQNPEQWDQQATQMPGSWWPVWTKWLSQHSGKKVRAAQAQGSAQFKVLEAAPGRYVKVKAV